MTTTRCAAGLSAGLGTQWLQCVNVTDHDGPHVIGDPTREAAWARRLCPGCHGELTTTDTEAGRCTQCDRPIGKAR